MTYDNMCLYILYLPQLTQHIELIPSDCREITNDDSNFTPLTLGWDYREKTIAYFCAFD